MTRKKTKTEVATIKLTPQCRLAWEAAAAAETRSLANLFEVAIFEYCRRHQIAAPVADTMTELGPRPSSASIEGTQVA